MTHALQAAALFAGRLQGVMPPATWLLMCLLGINVVQIILLCCSQFVHPSADHLL